MHAEQELFVGYEKANICTLNSELTQSGYTHYAISMHTFLIVGD